VERAPSKKLNSTVVVFKSKSKPGYVYRFNHKKGDEYVCCRCRELGKCPAITIRNDVVVGRKDPEVDHHEDCQPLPEEDVSAQGTERDMLQDVKFSGKRPTEAYNDTQSGVAKKFKSSAEQVCNRHPFLSLCIKEQPNYE